jgi:predicted permease
MRTWRGWAKRLRAWVADGTRDRQLGDELESIVEMHIDEYLRSGMTRDEARRRALIEIGGVVQVRQAVRDDRGFPWVEGWARDAKYATRTLLRTPGFSLVAIVVMAIGIGASVALFTVVRSVVLRPLPFPRSDRLAALYSQDDRSKPDAETNVSSGDFYDWQKASHGYEQMAIWRWSGYNTSGSAGELPEFLNAGTCSWNLFATLGASPALGRLFTRDDDHTGAGQTVILSWSFYERRLDGDPNILGKSIRLNSKNYTVIGVLPPWFRFPDPKIQLWVPWQAEASVEAVASHYIHNAHVVARLAASTSPSAALQEINAVQDALYTRLSGAGSMEQGVIAKPLLEDMVGSVKQPLYVLLAAVVCLLLIACLNLSNLLVARAAARRREMAIRSAMGSGRLSNPATIDREHTDLSDRRRARTPVRRGRDKVADTALDRIASRI